MHACMHVCLFTHQVQVDYFTFNPSLVSSHNGLPLQLTQAHPELHHPELHHPEQTELPACKTSQQEHWVSVLQSKCDAS